MKKNIGICILCIILSILVVGLSGYIIYDKMLSSHGNSSLEKSDKKDIDSNIRKLNDIEIDKLINQIKDYNMYFSYSYPINDIKTISSRTLFDFAISKMERSNDEYPVSGLEEIISKYFGSNVKMKHEDIVCGVDNEVLFNYNSSTNSYSYNYNHPGHGGGGSFLDVKAFYLDGTIENEEDITINIHSLYSDYCGDVCGYPEISYYASYNDAVKGKNPVFTDSSNENSEYIFTDEDYNMIKDKLPITTYKFKKDKNGNFGLISVTI